MMRRQESPVLELVDVGFAWIAASAAVFAGAGGAVFLAHGTGPLAIAAVLLPAVSLLGAVGRTRRSVRRFLLERSSCRPPTGDDPGCYH
jgi:hypothetical protein